MKTRLGIVMALMVLLIAALPCSAQENARQFIAAMEAYKAGDYAKAVKVLSDIASAGVHNGQLYYNLGNACLKNNDLGQAILWYERALRLLPNDPDLIFNYEYARSLTQDAQEQTVNPIVAILFFWQHRLSARTVILLSLCFNFLFFLLAASYRLTRRRGLRHAALTTLLPTVILIFTAAYNYYDAAYHPQAIVLPEKIAVRSGLNPESTELFQLHAGAKVKVVRQMKDHVQVRFSQDKIGWVESGVVGRI
jgi:tetratricopeptide (TPR) repeat protein